MIAEDRSVAFWRDVLDHPLVKPHVAMGQEIDLAALLASDRVTPMRAAHGGFMFVQLDGLGRVYELHTLFTPEGWGREVFCAAVEAFDLMFARGARLITTYEVLGNWRSRPPRTFRFEAAGDFDHAAQIGADVRTWFLTAPAWSHAPARKRTDPCR